MLCILVCCCRIPVNGQELVPNGGFEAYNACPTGLSNIARINAPVPFPTVQDWFSPNLPATPDYFNGCTVNPGASVPLNHFGFQPAHGGRAYAGIYAQIRLSVTPYDYREYIATRLVAPMVKDSIYCIRFFVSPGTPTDGRHMALWEVGAVLTDTIPTVVWPNSGVLFQSKGVQNDSLRFLTDTAVWYEIKGNYIAKGGEEWLTIGCFAKAPQLIILPLPGTGDLAAYYFVDDVSVVPARTQSAFQRLMRCDTVLTLTSSAPAGPYSWNTGAATRSIQVTAGGLYTCGALADCITYHDSFLVSTPPVVDSMHAPIPICTTSHVPLVLSSPRPAGSYQWNTGATTRTLTVNRPGTFTSTTLYNCVEYRDIFTVVADSIPAPTVRDTTICQHITAPVLEVRDTGLIWYLLVTDDSGLRTQPQISTALAGEFTLWVARQTGNCISAKVPLHITIQALPQAHNPATLLRCDDGTRQHQVMGIQLEPEVQYAWSTGDSACCIIPQTDGRYIRTARNSCGLATDTFYLRSTSCDSCIIFPNAFSPNGDGVNDGFRALEICPVSDYRLRIHDRWGRQVFETDRKDSRWDGRFKGAEASAGTYMYYATFTTVLSDRKQLVKGSVILFR